MLEIKVMLDEGAKMPTKAHEHDAGFDLYSREDKVIFPHESYTFETGVHMAIEPGYAGLLVSKSGLNKNLNVQSTGLVDADYTGGIGVTLYNHGSGMVRIKKGQKISQIVLMPILYAKLVLSDALEATERGDGGFGSSGAF